MVGVRFSARFTRSYSSGVKPCSLMTASVISGSVTPGSAWGSSRAS